MPDIIGPKAGKPKAMAGPQPSMNENPCVASLLGKGRTWKQVSAGHRCSCQSTALNASAGRDSTQ
ncbi:hypothetical protein [Stenotrophomonas humi]|uniref:hypothetical protein n=1 Tax=Stenotrophomonas humi TaxID=405444 RepID=UPI00128F5091|nr:hypothetical protein [Stenotrophomonas humi]